jgi:hypothetical protein
MTFAQLITLINTYIVANGNNEITANVLNPILQALAEFTNNKIGDLDTLTTSDKTSVVNSINSLKTDFNNLNNNGVQLHIGYDSPLVTPPSTYNYADFYMELDSLDDSPIQLWQWSGTEWNTYSNVYSKAEIDLIVANIYTAIGTASISSKRFSGSGQTYTLPENAVAFKGWINDGVQQKEMTGFEADLNTFTQSGLIVTFKKAITTGARIIIDYYF